MTYTISSNDVHKLLRAFVNETNNPELFYELCRDITPEYLELMKQQLEIYLQCVNKSLLQGEK